MISINKNVFNLNAPQLKTLVHGEYEGAAKSIKTDLNGYVNVRSSDAQFGTILNAERTPIFDLKSIYGISQLRDAISVTSATITNNGTEYLLQTDATTGAIATLDSAERGRYIAGSAGEAGIAVRLPSNTTGSQEASWGYFDDQNGAFFGQDAGGLFISLLRGSVEQVKVYQDDWNVDPVNGTGPSGLNIELAAGNIYQVVYSWYGYGTIEWRVVLGPTPTPQNVVVVHRYRPNDETSMTDPNLPVRARVRNGVSTAASFSLYVAGRQYGIQGKYDPQRRITSQYVLSLSSGIGTTFRPVISFRRKADFPVVGRVNSASVKIQGFDIISTADLLYQVRFNPALTGASWQTPTDTSASETAVESDVTATALSGGELIYEGLVIGASLFSRAVSTQDELDLDLNNVQPVTYTVRTVSGSGTITMVFRVREEW